MTTKIKTAISANIKGSMPLLSTIFVDTSGVRIRAIALTNEPGCPWDDIDHCLRWAHRSMPKGSPLPARIHTIDVNQRLNKGYVPLMSTTVSTKDAYH